MMLFVARRADASAILVTTRAGMLANDFIDWGSFGAAFTIPANPSTGTTNLGVGFSVSQTLSGPFERLDEGNGWLGNFAPGDHLLVPQEVGSTSANAITLDFNSLVFGGGAQIQADFRGAFTARITALDGLGNPIASFIEAGTADASGDNSAIFIGILSDTANIDKLVFSLDSAALGTVGDFAINRVSLSDGPVAIPEPATLSFLGLGLAGLVARRGKR